MMFCLLYSIESMGAKKSLEREIPEGETPSERGQQRLFLESLSQAHGGWRTEKRQKKVALLSDLRCCP
jgi:hypothetical protein